MKHIIRRLAASGMTVKSRIKVGSNCLDLVDDSSRRLLLNGYDALSCGGGDLSEDSFSAFLADLLSKMFQSGQNKAIVMLDSGSDGVMRGVADRLNKSLGTGTAELQKTNPQEGLSVSPADHKMEQAINTDALAQNAGVLASRAAKVASAIVDGHDAALMMTRKKIVASMWGAEKIQSILDGVRGRVEDVSLPWARVAISADMMAKSAARLQRKISSKSADDESLVAKILIPSITDGYALLKAASEVAAMSFVPLVYIDPACKVNTTYPATWFFDQDILDGVSQGYDGVLDFLTQVPAMESKVVDPLASVRMRIMDGAR